MSSYLDKQRAAFKGDVMSAAPKITGKSTLTAASPVSAPSPAPSNSSTTSRSEVKDMKRKREAQVEVYSQPAATGYGEEAGTQVTYVIDFLKKKDEPKTFQEILEYLSLVQVDDRRKKNIADILKRHGKVQWRDGPVPKGSKPWASGTYTHKPTLAIKKGTDLIAYLQKKPDAQGIRISDLKDGWPNCEGTVRDLENEHRILVLRTKKDGQARSLWANDPSLFHSIDLEFQDMWYKTELPSVDDLVRKLQEAGQKPASEDPSKRIKAAPNAKEKKRKAPRKGKTSNMHMEHLLKDFSHVKRR